MILKYSLITIVVLLAANVACSGETKTQAEDISFDGSCANDIFNTYLKFRSKLNKNDIYEETKGLLDLSNEKEEGLRLLKEVPEDKRKFKNLEGYYRQFVSIYKMTRDEIIKINAYAGKCEELTSQLILKVDYEESDVKFTRYIVEFIFLDREWKIWRMRALSNTNEKKIDNGLAYSLWGDEV